MYQVFNTEVMSNIVSNFVTYLNTIWLYFSTHWWLGLLFVIYHILLWQQKNTVDQTNTYYQARQKRSRQLISIAQCALKKSRETLRP